jgi:16S rRNA (uracil1498-N3)-methyltransferase
MNIFVERIKDNLVKIVGKDVEHLKVRRNKPGHFFKISETHGQKYADAQLVSLDKKEAVFKIKNFFKKPEESTTLTLYQAVIKKVKMELVVQKAVELGVNKIVPVMTERVSEKSRLNMYRFSLIIKEAAMQSERLWLPSIEEVVTFSQAIQADNLFCLGERTTRKNLKQFLFEESNPKSIAVLVGPEGGFTETEFSMMQAKRVPVISFGDNIMRSETAAIAVLSAIKCFYLADKA